MEYQREIGDFLVIEPCVTASWLANTLHITVSKAASLLANFKKTHKDVHATYLINGRDGQNNFTFTIVVEEEVEKVKKTLSNVVSTQVYSLEKVSTESIKTQIVETYMSLATSLLVDAPATSTQNSILGNASGQIIMKGLDVRPVGERILSTQNKHWTKSIHVPSSSAASSGASAKIASASSSVAAAPVVAQIKSADQVKAFFNKPSTTTSSSKPEPKPEAKSFFKTTSNSSQASIEPTPVASQESVKLEVLKPKTEKTKSPVKKVSKEDDDEEFDDGTVPSTTGKKRSNTSPKKKATPAMSLEDSEDEGESEEVKTKKAKTAKTNINVRGALDDFMEDAAIEQFKKEQENPTQKKTKKVLVEKVSSHSAVCCRNAFDSFVLFAFLIQMFADEKGYLVTEMIWEEVTDDEQPNVSDIKPHKPKPSESSTAITNRSTSESKPAAAAKGKKEAPAAKASTGAQKNMMSFFTKK